MPCSASARTYLSSRIGESLIFDLRTKVFAHVQRMSLAFFTRTQTGALVSRLNNDVIGAQRAFTSTLSSTVSNSISVVVVGITMFALSWQVTLACLALFPVLLLASRWVGRQISGLTRRQMDGNADLGNMMTSGSTSAVRCCSSSSGVATRRTRPTPRRQGWSATSASASR